MQKYLIISIALWTFSLNIAESKYHQRSQPTFQQKGEWTIYTAEYFEEHELCQVLSCNKERDVCMARNNNAMCVEKRKLHEIEGEKFYFQKSKPHHENNSKTRQYHQEKSHKQENKEREIVQDKEWKDHYAKKLEKHKEKTEKINHKKSQHPNEYHKPQVKDSEKKIEKTNSISERHSGDSKPKFDCTDQQLREMGGRLLQWFSDVHATEQGVTAPLPKHHISCRQDVGWMFQQLDGDQDGRLTTHELYSLEHDRYEPCITPFLDRCDIGGDDKISLDEWCDCFQWSDHVKEEPACHKAQRKSDPHMIGAFIPRCDVDGFYRPEQCHEGLCWCVDRIGREFDHSRTRGHADCGQYAESSDDEDHPAIGSGDKEDTDL